MNQATASLACSFVAIATTACDPDEPKVCEVETLEGGIDDELDSRSSYSAADVIDRFGARQYEVDLPWDPTAEVDLTPSTGVVPLRVRFDGSADGRARLSRFCGSEVYVFGTVVEIELGDDLVLVDAEGSVAASTVSAAGILSRFELEEIRPALDIAVPHDDYTWRVLITTLVEYDYDVQSVTVDLAGWDGPIDGPPDEWLRVARFLDVDELG